MQAIAEGEQLLKFIPQRQPMVMIDKLFFSDAEKCITGLHITEQNIFCSDGFFREPGLIENMAQTAAVQAGSPPTPRRGDSITHLPSADSALEPPPSGGRGAPIGYIGAIKNLVIHFLPPVNSEIVTEIKITHRIFDATVVNAFVTSKDGIAAECELKIFIKKE